MKKSLFISVFAIAVVSSLAIGLAAAEAHDGADHIQHHVKFMTKLLSLTPEQQQQATTIFTNAHASMEAQHGNLKTARESLKQAIVANNAAGIDQSAATLGNLMTQAISTRAKAQAAFYQILTPEQQTKLTEFEKTHHHGNHPHWGQPPDGPPQD